MILHARWERSKKMRVFGIFIYRYICLLQKERHREHTVAQLHFHSSTRTHIHTHSRTYATHRHFAASAGRTGMENKPATVKQLGFLKSLGCPLAPKNMMECSALIDKYKAM